VWEFNNGVAVEPEKSKGGKQPFQGYGEFPGLDGWISPKRSGEPKGTGDTIPVWTGTISADQIEPKPNRSGDGLKWTVLYRPERSRTYVFPGNEEFRVDGVTRICVRPSGSHRLETKDGLKVIVKAGWLAIKIVADDWSL
jgi:hypothetical protein